jgi:hypothetical protein
VAERSFIDDHQETLRLLRQHLTKVNNRDPARKWVVLQSLVCLCVDLPN